MTDGEVAELFIRAAEIELRMPSAGERPRGFGGYVLQWVRTYEDKLNWRREPGDQLIRGDNPLAEERQAFTDGRSSKVTSPEVTLWETCIRWTGEILDDERQRRALWAWAFAKAGGKAFNRWCFRIERIHPETGSRRKNRALKRISDQLARHAVQNVNTQDVEVLIGGPENRDNAATVESAAPATKHGYAWAADDAFSPFLVDGPDDFSWADKRNELRRKRRSKESAAAP